ncbi:unnamed protein product [Linum trigynum]|uniref:RNase H type-1 domain-containing protein n=1 Tax=Linum trigynum TaxID=586398 RepID=A0AAV2EEV0_9ROSI
MAPSPASSAIKSGHNFIEWEESRTSLALSSSFQPTLLHPQPRGSRSNTPPPPFSRVIYCDGSFVSDSRLVAYGITIANSHGQVYDGKAETFLCSHPIQAEALGLLNAILLAVQDGIPTCIRTDCQVLSLALNQDSSAWPWHCRATIAQMSLLLRSAPWIRIEFVPRRLNRLADWVACQVRDASLPLEWILILNIIAPLL